MPARIDTSPRLVIDRCLLNLFKSLLGKEGNCFQQLERIPYAKNGEPTMKVLLDTSMGDAFRKDNSLWRFFYVKLVITTKDEGLPRAGCAKRLELEQE